MRSGLNPSYYNPRAMLERWLIQAAHWLPMTVVVLVSACTTPRQPAPPLIFSRAVVPGFPTDIRYVASDRRRFAHAADLVHQLRASSRDGTIKVLALSGGGAVGAFGAGALVGLGQAGARPEFQIVTGVSAGALLAPFAYLGPTWDDQLIEAFSGHSTANLLRPRGVGILIHPGWYRGEPLAQVIDHFVTSEMIQAVARESQRGRLLEVATTDLDNEETVIWDLGKIARVGGEPARKLFRDVLTASASIPGLFPPMIIHVEEGSTKYDEMHVDGSVSTPFFAAPESAFLVSLDESMLHDWSMYVLVNGQLTGLPSTTRIRSIPILSHSFSATLRHDSRSELLTTAGFAHRYGIALKFTSLPIDYPQDDPLDFHEATLQTLFNYGKRCAELGRLWTTLEQALLRSERVATQGARELTQRGRLPVPLQPDCPLDDTTLGVPAAPTAE